MSKGDRQRPTSKGLSEEEKDARYAYALGSPEEKEEAKKKLIEMGVLDE